MKKRFKGPMGLKGRIAHYAQKHDVDPDLMRAVMYAENARGHYIIANKMADTLKISDSILPMNIQKHTWSPLLDKKPEDMYDEDTNIETSAVLLRRIADRIDYPSAEKVGSVWNYIGRERTSEFGEYIGRLYREKPWKRIE